MEPDAPIHPRFKYFPEAGEDPYHSFLGVPLIESGAVQGVLVVQTVERRAFSPNEIRMLVTVGSQLAPLVSGARLLERVAAADVEARGGRSRGLPPADAAIARRDRALAGDRRRSSLSDRPGRRARGCSTTRRPATPPPNSGGCNRRWRPPGKRSRGSAAGSPRSWAKTTARSCRRSS